MTDFFLASSSFWIALVFLGCVVLLVRFAFSPLAQMVKDHQSKIRDQFSEAEKLLEEAQNLFDQAKERERTYLEKEVQLEAWRKETLEALEEKHADMLEHMKRAKQETQVDYAQSLIQKNREEICQVIAGRVFEHLLAESVPSAPSSSLVDHVVHALRQSPSGV